MTPEHSGWDECVRCMKYQSEDAVHCEGDFEATITQLEGFPDLDVEGTISYFKSLGVSCDCELLTDVLGLEINDPKRMIITHEYSQIYSALTCATEDAFNYLAAREYSKESIKNFVINTVKNEVVAFSQ